MVDDQPTGGPDPDNPLRSADEAAAPDDAWVRALLADLDFLRPDPTDSTNQSGAVDLTDSTDPTDESGAVDVMPPWVWAQVSATLAAEAGNVGRRPAWVRWGGGLVAASVAVLAIGVAVTAFSGGNQTPGGNEVAVMAGSAPDAAQLQKAAPAIAAAPELQEAPRLSFAGMVPPAVRLTGSEIDYTPEGLAGQVTEVLEAMNMEPETALDAMKSAPVELVVPDPEPPLLLQSSIALRACITKLTQLDTSTALVIDWSTFQGEEAGVIVIPEYSSTGQPVPDVTELDVWVVDHECVVRDDEHISMR